MSRCILHNRFTYYYVPNNMTKVKYGNMSDFAILISLLAHKVSKITFLLYRTKIKLFV
jgi:hypothetical protein